VMILPLALYLARKTGERRWWLAMFLLVVGTSASRSRTAILMLVIEVVVLLALRPREVKRFWPAIVPLALAIHLASPGSFGVISSSFHPAGGLIAQQANAPVGSGRVSSLSPALKQWDQSPLVGIGYGTRITDEGPTQNANILDDQWMGTLLETGIAGALAWVWVFLRSIRRLAAAAKRDQSVQGWLPAGIAAAVTAFALSMFTYDAFSFAQETFLLLILLGIGAIPVVGGLAPATVNATERRRVSKPRSLRVAAEP
jgi:polysaccharide biosynthesis protein PslJ